MKPASLSPRTFPQFLGGLLGAVLLALLLLPLGVLPARAEVVTPLVVVKSDLPASTLGATEAELRERLEAAIKLPPGTSLLVLFSSDEHMTKDDFVDTAVEVAFQKFGGDFFYRNEFGVGLKEGVILLVISPSVEKMLLLSSPALGYAEFPGPNDLREGVYQRMIPAAREERFADSFVDAATAITERFVKLDEEAEAAKRRRADEAAAQERADAERAREKAEADARRAKQWQEFSRGLGGLGRGALLWVVIPGSLAGVVLMAGKRPMEESARRGGGWGRVVSGSALTVPEGESLEGFSTPPEDRRLLSWAGPDPRAVDEALEDWEKLEEAYREQGLEVDSLTQWAVSELHQLKAHGYSVSNKQRGDREWREAFEQATTGRAELLARLREQGLTPEDFLLTR